MSVVLTEAVFSISLTSPVFSTGSIRYDAVFTNFTRAAHGSAARLALSNENHGFSSFSSYDRLTTDVAVSTPVEPTTFGRVKSLYRR